GAWPPRPSSKATSLPRPDARSPMARLIFVNRYFYPDHSATSQILSDLTFHLAAAGHEVHVLASRQIYDEPDAALPACETINGVKVHRVARRGSAEPLCRGGGSIIYRFTDQGGAISARSGGRATLWSRRPVRRW